MIHIHSNSSCSAAGTSAAGLRPGARRAILRPSSFSRPETNSGAERTSGGFGRARFAEVVFSVRLQQLFQVRNPIQDRAHRDERVVYPGKVGLDAGPLPVFRPRDQSGARPLLSGPAHHRGLRPVPLMA
jgi:hypothetical protein